MDTYEVEDEEEYWRQQHAATQAAWGELGLDTDPTEDITFVGNTTYWPPPHNWDETLPHNWHDEPKESWMDYDPREGF